MDTRSSLYMKALSSVSPSGILLEQGWSNSRTLNWLHSGSLCGSEQRQVGEKKEKPRRVRNAARHLGAVWVEQDTVKKVGFTCIKYLNDIKSILLPISTPHSCGTTCKICEHSESFEHNRLAARQSMGWGGASSGGSNPEKPSEKDW